MEDLKKKVEALLFSSGRRMSIDELTKLCRRSPEEINEVMHQLKKEYEEKKSSLMVVDEGNFWKLTTKEGYLNLVKSIVTKTELTKTLTETLAVIAFKYPIKQSDLIKIRTNKAYDHLKELEEAGYITRQKYGRTKLIKLTQKFFDYFSLPKDKLKEQFQDFEGLAEAIESKEDEIKKIKEEQKKMAKEAGQKEVDLVDDKGHKVKLDVVEEPPEEEKGETPKVEQYKDTLGNLEVVEEPEIKPKEEKEQEEPSEPKEEPKEIKVPNEIDEKVDERVNEILGVQEKEAQAGEEEQEETAEEPIEEEAADETPAEEEPENSGQSPESLSDSKESDKKKEK